MTIRISSCVIDLIQRAAVAAAPDEACGLLFGDDGAIDRATIAANVAADPRRRFEIDPAALFAAIRAERAGRARVVGYWHSHPSGDAAPSPTDAAMARDDGMLWLIATGTTFTLWRAGAAGRHGRFDPVDISAG